MLLSLCRAFSFITLISAFTVWLLIMLRYDEIKALFVRIQTYITGSDVNDLEPATVDGENCFIID